MHQSMLEDSYAMSTSHRIRSRSRASIADFTAWALFALLLLAVALPAAAQSQPKVDLELTKSVDKQFAAVGEDVVYTITVSNKSFYGQGTKATNVFVKDYLPPGLTALGYSATTGGQHGITFDLATLTWKIEWLNVGQSVNLQFKARVNQTGEFKNCAEIWDADQKDHDSKTGDEAGGALLGLNKGEDDEDCAEFWAVNTGSISGMVFEDTDGNGLFDHYESGLEGFEIDLNKIGNDHLCGTHDDTEVAFTDSDAQGNYTFWDVLPGTYCVEIDDNTIPHGFQRTTANPVKVTVGAGQDVTGVKFGFVKPRIDLELTKVVDNENPTVGDKVTFTLTLKNNNKDGYGQTIPTPTATGIQVADYLPHGLSLWEASSGSGITFDASKTKWHINRLDPGKSVSLTLIALVEKDGELTNCAEVWDAHQKDRDSRTGDEAGGQLVGDEDDQDCASLWARPRTIDLELTKVVDNPYPTVGDKVTFTLTLKNNDQYGQVQTATATGIQVKDYLPQGLTFHAASPTGNGISFDQQNLTWHISQLGAGKSISLVMEALVSTDGEFENCAEVWDDNEFDRDSKTGEEAGGILVGHEDDQDCAALWASPRTIDLELTKVVDNPYPSVGDVVNFTITIKNNDQYGTVKTATATGVQVKDYLPHGLSLVAAHAPSGTSFDTGSTTWHIDQLKAGKSLSLVLEASVDKDGEFTNCAEVWDDNEVDRDSKTGEEAGGQLVGDEDDQDCASLWASPSLIDLEVTKTIKDATLTVGDIAEFTIVVTNNEHNASAKATNVMVSDYLPHGFWLIEGSAKPNSNGVTFDDTNVKWTIEWMNPGDSVTLTLKARAEKAGEFTNCAEVWDADQKDFDSKSGAEAGGVLVGDEDDQDCVEFWVEDKPLIDLEVDKAIDRTQPKVGDNVTFTITVTNNNKKNGQTVPTAKATNVIVKDYLPAGFWLQSGSSPQASSHGVTFNSSTGTFHIEWMNPGDSVTLLVKGRVDQKGEFENCAEIWDADQMDRDSRSGEEAGGALIGDEDDDDCVVYWVGGGTPPPADKIDLELDKSIDNPNPKLGDTVTFTLKLTNNDREHGQTKPTAKATNVIVKDYLPAGFWLLQGSSPQASSHGISFNASDATFHIEWMNPGDSVTLLVKGRVDQKGEFQNCAEVWDADQLDRDSRSGAVAGGKLVGSEDDQDCVSYWVGQGTPPTGKGSVTGVVFNDKNLNGTRESGEPGLFGFEVDLTTLGSDYKCGTSDDVEVATVDTDANGAYSFWDVTAGTYCVRILQGSIPQGFTPTSPLAVRVEVTAGGNVKVNFGFKSHHTPPPPPPTSGMLCYLVADNDNNGTGSADVFTTLAAGASSDVKVGGTWTSLIEAIAYNPWTGKLFATDGGDLGTINLHTGEFTEIGDIGGGEGEDGWLDFNDVDGLSFNPYTTELWGSVRRTGERDFLIKIDPKTGSAVKNAFGPGVDYIVIKPEVTNWYGPELDDIDDLAWDPETGDLYAINNHDGMDSRLVILQPNSSGAWITKVLELPLENVEGLAFFNNGTLYGTAGEGDEKIVKINKRTLAVTVEASLGAHGNRDYEAIDCLTAEPSNLTVVAFGGQQVDLYRDLDQDGSRGDADLLVATTTADANGLAEFSVAATGSFLVDIQGGAQMAASIEGYGMNLQATASGVSTSNETATDLPGGFALAGNYPNPFNPQTTVRFEMPESGHVRLSVHDVLGREIAVLVDGVVGAGQHDVTFEAGDLPSGTYMARLAGDLGVQTRTMVLLK